MLEAPEIITTERLVLRHPRLSDAEAIFVYASDPMVVHYMDYPPPVHVDELLQSIGEHPKRWNAGSFSWVITIKPDDRAIGTIACTVEENAAEFGHLLNQRYWKRGYATEESKSVVQWAIELPNVSRVWATCDTENLASARVLEKCSLVCEGRLHDYQVRPNISETPRDALMYAMVCNGD